MRSAAPVYCEVYEQQRDATERPGAQIRTPGLSPSSADNQLPNPGPTLHFFISSMGIIPSTEWLRPLEQTVDQKVLCRDKILAL